MKNRLVAADVRRLKNILIKTELANDRSAARAGLQRIGLQEGAIGFPNRWVAIFAAAARDVPRSIWVGLCCSILEFRFSLRRLLPELNL